MPSFSYQKTQLLSFIRYECHVNAQGKKNQDIIEMSSFLDKNDGGRKRDFHFALHDIFQEG